MTYDIAIPIRIGLFSLAVAILVGYFMMLSKYLIDHPDKKMTTLVIILHMIILIGGLLLTGFAGWLQ